MHPDMALRKITIGLVVALAALVTADFHYEHFKTFGIDDARRSWFANGHPGRSYRSESTQQVPRLAGVPYPYDNAKPDTNPIPSILGPGIKKIPNEDKAFKKALSSSASIGRLPDPDDARFKAPRLKSGAPRCQEIAAKQQSQVGAGPATYGQKPITCYRCKDSKNGATYEYCSYSAQQPRSDTRQPRSSLAAAKLLDSLSSAATPYRDSRKAPATGDRLSGSYRFSDDYFQPEASHELPAGYDKTVDSCERVKRDSMICMICKNPKTNGKYEQCSYVAQPNEKAYAYTKSSSFGPTKAKPRDQPRENTDNKGRKIAGQRKDDEVSESGEDSYGHDTEPEELSEREEAGHSAEASGSAEDKEGHGSHYVPEHTYHYPGYKDYKASFDNYDAEDGDEDSGSSRSAKSKSNCKTLEKDGQTCTTCTDPKTGGKSESCNYSHEPKDKVYKYSKSKSFGYPESRQASDGESEMTSESLDKRERESSAEDYTGDASEPSTLDYIRSESEKISEKVKGKGECQKVKKNAMVCTICKDPKTGGNFEQCNYSFDPDDKVYAYSKSTSFGNPTKTSAEDDYASSDEERPEEHPEERPEETYSLPIIYPTGTSVSDYVPKASKSQSSGSYVTKKPQVQNDEEQSESHDKASKSKVDSGFYDATVRRAEIEKIVKKIGEEDRSKCKKILRGDMTCYKCADDKGFTNEECVYVAEPRVEASKKKSIQVEEASSISAATVKPLDGTNSSVTEKLLEPLTSNSRMSVVSNRKIREAKGQPRDQDEELEALDEERREAEPYEYVAETRPVYDKVLGITLPAYMLQKSPHEIEFDAIVENSTF